MEIKVIITGISHFIDIYDLEVNQEILLRKDYTNKYDGEAIAAYINNSMQIGYIANSVHTVAKGTYSAGRLYDKIGDSARARILIVTHHNAIGVVSIDD